LRGVRGGVVLEVLTHNTPLTLEGGSMSFC